MVGEVTIPGLDEAESRLVRCALGRIEFDALDHIARTLGLRANAIAVRYAIVQQAAWAVANGTPFVAKGRAREARAADDKIIDRRLVDVDRGDMRVVRDSVFVPQEGGLKQWSFLAEESLLDRLKDLAKAWQVDHRAEAIRLAIRLQAAATGWEPTGGWPGLFGG